MRQKVLVTGALGFIGYHITRRLLENGFEVVGIDNINSYYDVKQKYDKLPLLGIEQSSLLPNKLVESEKFGYFKFGKLDITDRDNIEKLFNDEQFDIVVNLAAQAGVQYSIKNPHNYIENNITGFINIIDAAKICGVKHFIYASSSSVYGNSDILPYDEKDTEVEPISLYAASKRANEMIAHSYSHLYHLKTTGLRLFTVYGPWGRPDMAPFIFTKNIIEGENIILFNEGKHARDFTYIDDVVSGILCVINNKPRNEYVYNIYNLARSRPVSLIDFVRIIEKKLNKKAKIDYKPLRKGDVLRTHASISKIADDFGYSPKVDIEKGIGLFIDWYIDFFKI